MEKEYSSVLLGAADELNAIARTCRGMETIADRLSMDMDLGEALAAVSDVFGMVADRAEAKADSISEALRGRSGGVDAL